MYQITTNTSFEVIYLIGIPINIDGVFQSFDSNGVLLVPDPNQSQIRKGKTEMSSTWSTTL
jgi:hypothetical protein